MHKSFDILSVGSVIAEILGMYCIYCVYRKKLSAWLLLPAAISLILALMFYRHSSIAGPAQGGI